MPTTSETEAILKEVVVRLVALSRDQQGALPAGVDRGVLLQVANEIEKAIAEPAL